MLRIGSLEKQQFPRGIYLYIGSALNSLPARIRRHLRAEKRIHWHIDYLLRSGVEILAVAWRPTRIPAECRISRWVGRHAAWSVNRFGCSDCECVSHLHYYDGLNLARKAVLKAGLQLNHAITW